MKESKKTCDLNTCFLCTYCMPEWLEAIKVHKKNFAYRKGQQIFAEGEPVTGIYFVYLGKVKVHKHWDEEKEFILRFAKKGDILGHMGLGHDPLYPVSTTALENTVLCYIELPFFESSLLVNPKLTYNLLKFFASELQESEKRMRNLVQMPVKERVALALLNLKRKFGLDESGAIDIELTRQDLASYAAVSYETLFKVSHDFFQNNWIEASGKSFRVLNEGALLELTAEKR